MHHIALPTDFLFSNVTAKAGKIIYAGLYYFWLSFYAFLSPFNSCIFKIFTGGLPVFVTIRSCRNVHADFYFWFRNQKLSSVIFLQESTFYTRPENWAGNLSIRCIFPLYLSLALHVVRPLLSDIISIAMYNEVNTTIVI